MKKKRVLITIDAYLPGYKFGGPLRSVANIVDWLGGEYDFHVLTKDRDLGDRGSYSGILTNVWTAGPNGCRVFYSREGAWTMGRLYDEVWRLKPDVLYLNGLWEQNTRRLLWLHWRGQLPEGMRVVLAPRGALGRGALGIKPWRKRLYLLLLFRLFRIHRGVIWQASAESEALEIQKVLGKSVPVKVVPNLLGKTLPESLADTSRADIKMTKRSGQARFVFVSRLSRTKHLDYLLRLLPRVSSPLSLDVIGPAEDSAYYHELQELVKLLPERHQVTFVGEMSPDVLKERLLHYDFFVLPTLNENFGHVFLEAWSAGLPVIISDQTPWTDLLAKGLGWDLPLADEARWLRVITQCCEMGEEAYLSMSQRCLRFYRELRDNPPLDGYRKLFSGRGE